MIKPHYSSLGVLSTVAALGFWVLPVISNGDNIFAQTRVCFRPKQVLETRNQSLLKCDSNERTRLLLTSVNKDLSKKDVEWFNKVASNKFNQDFSSNLGSVKTSQIVSMLFGVSGVILFGLDKKQLKENKSKQYQQKRLEIATNEGNTNYELYGYDNETPKLQRKLRDATFIRDKSKLDKEVSDNDLAIAENNQKIKKFLDKGHLSKDDTPASEEEILIELADEHKWYRDILNEPFKVITGISGSGKSTMENVFIQLARQDKQKIVVLYPNTTRTARDANSVVLSDVESINAYLEGFNELVNSRKADAKNRGIDEDDYLDYLSNIKGGCIAIYCMEANNWEQQGIDAGVLATFIRLSMIDIRKWGFTVTITGQSFNQGSFCSKLTNFAELLKKQTQVECIPTTNDKGRTIGSSKAMLKRPIDKEAGEVATLHYIPKDKSKY